jgi:serine/threonine-protein kinase
VKAPAHRREAPARPGLRRTLWLVGGVAAMAGAGYLVAALVVFPAPLLPNARAVPRLLGLPFAAAQAELAAAGLAALVVERERHPSAAPGTVTWQDPPPGVAVPRGDTVHLTVSDGPPRAAVPDVRGLDADLARRLLWGAGLRVDVVDSVRGDQPAGIALGTTPAAGDSVIAGGAVVLHLSKGAR